MSDDILRARHGARKLRNFVKAAASDFVSFLDLVWIEINDSTNWGQESTMHQLHLPINMKLNTTYRVGTSVSGRSHSQHGEHGQGQDCN